MGFTVRAGAGLLESLAAKLVMPRAGRRAFALFLSLSARNRIVSLSQQSPNPGTVGSPRKHCRCVYD